MGKTSDHSHRKTSFNIFIIVCKRLAIWATVLSFIVILLLISNTLLRNYLKSQGVIEIVRIHGHVDDAILITPQNVYIAATREIEGREKCQLQTRYNLGFTRMVSTGVIDISYRASVDYGIDLDEVIFLDSTHQVVLPSPHVQSINIDYGSVKSELEAGYLVIDEQGDMASMIRNLSRSARDTAESVGSLKEIKELTREQMTKLFFKLYQKSFKVIFSDEMNMKTKELL